MKHEPSSQAVGGPRGAPPQITGYERRRIREAFEQRERARGLAPRAGEPVRKAPSRPADSAVRRFIDRGFSEEMAREMAEQCVPHDVRSRWGGDQQL